MQRIIDFHAHAFSDDLAERAMKHLAAESEGVEPCHDGRLSSLIECMDDAGIEKSVVCPIATKPKQFDGILGWCKEIRSERIIPFPSIHPDDEKCLERLEEIKQAGFKGVKTHPYYQQFKADEEKMMAIYEKIQSLDLMLVMHTGYDIAFEFDDRSVPQRVLNVSENFPEMKYITTHFGGWEVWDDVEKYLIGKPIYMEISFSLPYLSVEQARRMILNHPKGYIMFGTDSPWQDHKLTIELLKKLDLGQEIEDLILYGNAERLLKS